MIQSTDNGLKEAVRSIVLNAGAARVSFAEAAMTNDIDREVVERWLADGRHGDMSYMERYGDLRSDPRLLLGGAKTVICCAFDYRQPQRHRLFADYALGLDYHEVIRLRLNEAAAEIVSLWGGDTRVCVDTAPIRERYWAAASGLGFIGLNGQLIVEGLGSKVFLAEILWTENISPDEPAGRVSCEGCGACVNACPGKALDGRCGVDARRCLSYLTIEYRGELPNDMRLDGRIYGCDICQDVCPHNRKTDDITTLEELRLRPELDKLTVEGIMKMEPQDFSRIFRHSAVKRTKLAGLRRNALSTKAEPDSTGRPDKADQCYDF